MTRKTSGHAAAMPKPGYSRPSQRDATGLMVTHITEDGAVTKVFDFREVDCPPVLLRSLVSGFAVATGTDGRWKSASSAAAGADTLRRFIREIAMQQRPPTSINEVGPEVWWTWRADVETKSRWPAAVNHMRVLLLDTPGLPDTTRKALRGRTRKPKTRLYDAYTRSEFQRIKSAASAIVRTGQQRIDANLATLTTYRAGGEPSDSPTVRIRGELWSAGSLLDYLARTGCVPTELTAAGQFALRRLLKLEGASIINEALFPNSMEALSMTYLLVCERGYNLSVINQLTVNLDRADDRKDEMPVHVLHLDKPRRGPAARFSDESLSGESGRLIDRAIALTAQARATMAELGYPTDSLLLFRSGNSYGGRQIFQTQLENPHSVQKRWHAVAGLLADDGTALQVTHQRLRLTEQVLNTKPRQNSQTVSESVYRRSDPQTRREATATIIRGQAEALEHARVTVAMRSLSDQDIAEAQVNPSALADRLGISVEKVPLLISGLLDTGTGACLDFHSSPFTHDDSGNCTASFLACLGCPNAVATPDHLPRLVALSDALERIASAVTPAVWNEDFSGHFVRLTALLTANTTAEQRDHARTQLSDADEECLERLLARRLDA
ncbi:unnamed protein product [Acidithrix sp. C25]|nr:unnamed protein product [Acidithrix sp. C25]